MGRGQLKILRKAPPALIRPGSASCSYPESYPQVCAQRGGRCAACKEVKVNPCKVVRRAALLGGLAAGAILLDRLECSTEIKEGQGFQSVLFSVGALFLANRDASRAPNAINRPGRHVSASARAIGEANPV